MMRFEVSTSSGSGAGKPTFPKAFSETAFAGANGLTAKNSIVVAAAAVASDTDSVGVGGPRLKGASYHTYLRRQFFHKEPCEYRYSDALWRNICSRMLSSVDYRAIAMQILG